MLTHFLTKMGTNCKATDNYSWNHYIQYPETVEKLDAKEALQKYKPKAVISSWTPPGNTFEQNVFETESVQLYITIGTKNQSFTGNHEIYQKQNGFIMEFSESLSQLLLPPSSENAVYIFRRKETK